MKEEWREGTGAGLYGSDVMAEVIDACGFPYLAINPGASFRGLHDSIVNHTRRGAQLVQCPHEKIAVQIAHGYAKVTGQAMGVLVHDTVGLLHATMGIYCAYMDRAPVVVFGGTGPMALEDRRPWIDWVHTANIQGNAVRDFTKWDDQPASIASVAPTVARAFRLAMSQPQGPVYVGLDAGLQEQLLEERPATPDLGRLLRPASGVGADDASLRELAHRLVNASRPLLVTGYVGRDPAAFELLKELVSVVGAGVIDTHVRLSFPTRHPRNVTGSDLIEEADVILFLDAKERQKSLTSVDPTARVLSSRTKSGAQILDLGFNELQTSAWSQDAGAIVETDLEVTADTAVALPRLIELCRREVSASESPAVTEWVQRVERTHRELRDGWEAEAIARHDDQPISTARLASSVWDAVRSHDWVLTAGTANDWALRLWDFDVGYRHVGSSLGTGTQIGISLGAALAHREAGRLVVDLQPDGDLLYDTSALWTAAYHEIPMLVVMFNNRAYQNDWTHQEHIALHRQRPVENAYLGMDFSDPAPDFAAIARSFGWSAWGPIEDPEELAGVLDDAVRTVVQGRVPALVDVICQPV